MNKEVVNLTSAEITEDILEAWKKEHKAVWRVAIDTDEFEIKIEQVRGWLGRMKEEKVKTFKQKVAYLRRPDRTELGYALTKIAQNDPLGAMEYTLKTCWLGGDPELIDDEDYFLGAASQLREFFDGRVGEIKKL